MTIAYLTRPRELSASSVRPENSLKTMHASVLVQPDGLLTLLLAGVSSADAIV